MSTKQMEVEDVQLSGSLSVATEGDDLLITLRLPLAATSDHEIDRLSRVFEGLLEDECYMLTPKAMAVLRASNLVVEVGG